MTTHDWWETEIDALIEDMLHEHAHLRERREETACRMALIISDLAALRRVVDRYRRKYGQPLKAQPIADSEAALYRGKTLADMLLTWANAHAAVIIVTDAARVFTAAGFFPGSVEAGRSLYPTIARMVTAGTLHREARGVYRVPA